EEGSDLILTLGLLERAGCVDQQAAGLQPARSALHQLPLQLRHPRNLRRFNPVQHIRVTAKDARRRAGRVEQYRVSGSIGLPGATVPWSDVSAKPGAVEVGFQPFEALGA